MVRITVGRRLMKRTTSWNNLHPRLCLNSSRNMCFIHCTSRCSGKFVITSFSRFVAHLTTVQALRSLTNQVQELHHLDVIGGAHQVFLSTKFTSLYFVMMSCNSELPTFRRRLQQCTPPLTNKYFHFTKYSIVSYLTTSAACPCTIRSRCTQRSLHAPRCCELPLNDILVMLAQSCDPCRLLGFLHPASRLRFQLRLSSRDPQDFAKRPRPT